MITELSKLANELDRKGLTKEADALDEMIKNALDADSATQAYMIYGAFHELLEDAQGLYSRLAKDLHSLAEQWQTMGEDRWLEEVYYSTQSWSKYTEKLYTICLTTRARLGRLVLKLGMDHSLVKGELGLEKVYRDQLSSLRDAITAAGTFIDEREGADLLSLSKIIEKLPEDQKEKFEIWSESPAVREFLLKSTIYPRREWGGYNELSDEILSDLIEKPSKVKDVVMWAGIVDSNLAQAVRDLRNMEREND